MEKSRTRFLVIILLVFALGIPLACSTTEKATDQKGSKDRTGVEITSEKEQLFRLLSRTRSTLADVYKSTQHDMPPVFMQRDTLTQSDYDNPFAGYRIQIFSSLNVKSVDSVSTHFRIWADTTFSGYQPKAYVFFRQPHYKVHIGDFQDQQRANRVSQMIKSRYPEAWVVHDRINPSLVPADTVEISIK